MDDLFDINVVGQSHNAAEREYKQIYLAGKWGINRYSDFRNLKTNQACQSFKEFCIGRFKNAHLTIGQKYRGLLFLKNIGMIDINEHYGPHDDKIPTDIVIVKKFDCRNLPLLYVVIQIASNTVNDYDYNKVFTVDEAKEIVMKVARGEWNADNVRIEINTREGYNKEVPSPTNKELFINSYRNVIYDDEKKQDLHECLICKANDCNPELRTRAALYCHTKSFHHQLHVQYERWVRYINKKLIKPQSNKKMGSYEMETEPGDIDITKQAKEELVSAGIIGTDSPVKIVNEKSPSVIVPTIEVSFCPLCGCKVRDIEAKVNFCPSCGCNLSSLAVKS